MDLWVVIIIWGLDQYLVVQNEIVMKKIRLILLLLALYASDIVLAQSDSIDYDNICYKETTTLRIENVEEFLYANKKKRNDNIQIVVYVITAQYVEQSSKYYGKQVILVSLDTVLMQSETGDYYHVKGISRQNTIRIGESYRFHLRLWGCVLYQLGPIPEFYTVEGLRIPVQICPYQPYKVMNLKGLSYIFLDETKK